MMRMYCLAIALFLTGTAVAQEQPAKRCAFNLKPQTLPGYGKHKPMTPKQVFDAALGDRNSATFANLPMHASCPYERAVELFGEDRVTFEEWEGTTGRILTSNPPQTEVRKIWRVMVDGEIVYEEFADVSNR